MPAWKTPDAVEPLDLGSPAMATGGATLRMAERAGLGNALLHLLTGDEFGAAEGLRSFVEKRSARLTGR